MASGSFVKIVAIDWPAGCASVRDGGCRRPSRQGHDGATARAADVRRVGRPTQTGWAAGSNRPPCALSSTLAIFRWRKRAVLRRARREAGEILAGRPRPGTAKNLIAARGPDALEPTHRQRSAALFGTRHCAERLVANRADVGRSRRLTRRGLTGSAWRGQWLNHATGAGRPGPGKGAPLGRWSPGTNAG